MISITNIVEIENFLRIMKERIKTEKFKAEKLPRPKNLEVFGRFNFNRGCTISSCVCVCVCVCWMVNGCGCQKVVEEVENKM